MSWSNCVTHHGPIPRSSIAPLSVRKASQGRTRAPEPSRETVREAPWQQGPPPLIVIQPFFTNYARFYSTANKY